MMPSKLPKKLPPRKPNDHHIKLVSGVKLPVEVPYRMTPLELVELRKQLTELLDVGLIQLSRASYRAPMLFQNK